MNNKNKTVKNFHLFTVTKNEFIEYDILSDKSQDELEFIFKKVIDNGEVSEIETKEDKVLFIHNKNRKSLPIKSHLYFINNEQSQSKI